TTWSAVETWHATSHCIPQKIMFLTLNRYQRVPSRSAIRPQFSPCLRGRLYSSLVPRMRSFHPKPEFRNFSTLAILDNLVLHNEETLAHSHIERLCLSSLRRRDAHLETK